MTIRQPSFTLKAGDSRTIRIRTTLVDGSPFDLSGDAEAVWIIARSERSMPDDLLVQKAAALESEAINGQTFWTIVVDLVPTDTQDIDPGPYYQAAKVRDKDGRQFTVEDGPIEIEPSPIPLL